MNEVALSLSYKADARYAYASRTWWTRAATTTPRGDTSVARAGRDGAAPHDLHAPLRHQPDGLGEQPVFLLQDARGERLDCVIIMHRHGSLEYDRPAVHLSRHQMHHEFIGRAWLRGILEQRREVTAPARDEHAHAHHGSPTTRSPAGHLTTRPMTRAPASALTSSSTDAGAQTSANPMPMLNTRY